MPDRSEAATRLARSREETIKKGGKMTPTSAIIFAKIGLGMIIGLLVGIFVLMIFILLWAIDEHIRRETKDEEK